MSPLGKVVVELVCYDWQPSTSAVICCARDVSASLMRKVVVPQTCYRLSLSSCDHMDSVNHLQSS